MYHIVEHSGIRTRYTIVVSYNKLEWNDRKYFHDSMPEFFFLYSSQLKSENNKNWGKDHYAYLFHNLIMKEIL